LVHAPAWGWRVDKLLHFERFKRLQKPMRPSYIGLLVQGIGFVRKIIKGAKMDDRRNRLPIVFPQVPLNATWNSGNDEALKGHTGYDCLALVT
jgi:hypothetical protein